MVGVATGANRSGSMASTKEIPLARYECSADRNRDLEVVHGVVARVVVDGYQVACHVRLTDDHGTVIGVDEPLDSQLRVTERLGNTVVPDDRAEPAALGDRPRRGDGEIAAGARPGRAPSGDLDRAHGEPVQVEIERRQRLCRAGIDTGRTGRALVHGEVVVRDVVPPIPVVREIRIADAGPAGVGARPCGFTWPEASAGVEPAGRTVAGMTTAQRLTTSNRIRMRTIRAVLRSKSPLTGFHNIATRRFDGGTFGDVRHPRVGRVWYHPALVARSANRDNGPVPTSPQSPAHCAG